MLNSLIEKINDLFGKAFIVGSLFPVLVLLAVNGTLLYLTDDGFREFVAKQDSGTTVALTSRALLAVVVVIVFTYAFSSIQILLRAILEGEYWVFPFGTWGRARHARRRDRISAKISEARGELHLLETDVKAWRTKLQQARVEGDAKPVSSFAEWPDRVDPRCMTGHHPGPALRRLRAARLGGTVIDRDDLETVSTALADALKKNPSSSDPESPDRDARRTLDRLNEEVAREPDGLLAYAVRRLDLEIANLSAQRSREYGRAEVAPSRVGNIARTAGAYTYDRYRFDVDLLWSRLQKVLQQDTTFYPTLQNAKTQLDFAVSTYCVVIVSGAFWLVHLATTTYSKPLYLAVAVGAPILAFAMHVVTIGSYDAFADSLRTAVDLYRRELARALHLSPPATLEEERVVWDDVSQFIAYGVPFKEKLSSKDPE